MCIDSSCHIILYCFTITYHLLLFNSMIQNDCFRDGGRVREEGREGGREVGRGEG